MIRLYGNIFFVCLFIFLIALCSCFRIYQYVLLTGEFIQVLNPDLLLMDLVADLAEIGYQGEPR